MRKLAQMGLAVAVAALAVPASSHAQEPAFPPQAYSNAGTIAPALAMHNHGPQDTQANTRFRMLPTKKKTAEQQRQELMAKGIYVPPVPPPPGTEMVMADGSVAGCATCQQHANYVISGPIEGQVLASSGEAPGHAFVGGMPAMGMATPAGEPAPIGVMRTNYSANSPTPISEAPGRAVVGGGAGAGAVPAPGAMGHEFAPSGYGRPNHPHVIQRLLGLPTIADLRERRTNRDDKSRERHAMQALGADTAPVGSLPPSMVYGPR